jgi:hypothetical protein
MSRSNIGTPQNNLSMNPIINANKNITNLANNNIASATNNLNSVTSGVNDKVASVTNKLNSVTSNVNNMNNQITNLMKNPVSTVMNNNYNNDKNSRSSNVKNSRGFPQPKCNGVSSMLDGDCFETGDPIKIVDAARDATTNVTNAAIHFAVTTGAVGLNKVLDVLSFTLIGLDNLNIENKEDILQRLEEKMILFQYLANDEKSKMIIKKLFGSLAIVIMEGSEVARVPLLRAFNNISNTTTSGVNNIMQNGSKFVKNAVKIIPGIGDAYIILDNALAIGIAGTRAAALMAKNADVAAETADKIIKRMRSKIEPRVETFENSVDDINKIRNNLDNLDLGSVLKNAENKFQNSIGNSIKNAGDNTTSAIQSVTPRLKGGKKIKKSTGKKTKKRSLKSSLKRKSNMKSKKIVRFSI